MKGPPNVAPKVLSLDAYGTLFAGGSDAFIDLVRALAGPQTDAMLARRETLIREISASGFVRMRERDRRILTDLFGRLGVGAAPRDGGAWRPSSAPDVERTLDDLAREYRHVTLYPDARRLLDALDAREIRWGIASNSDADVMDALVAEHGLKPHFVVTSESAKAYKPAPALFRDLLLAARAPAHDVLHVGDSWTADVEGAAAAGIPAVWLKRPGGLPKTDRARALAEVDDLTQVLALLPGSA